MKEEQIDTSSEFARVIDWKPQWSVGAPLPQIFSNGYQTYLTYFIDTRDPNWDGSYTTLIDNKSGISFPIAIVTFIRPNSHRFGIVNDEAANGHPLYDKGLDVYRAHIIENSTWIEEGHFIKFITDIRTNTGLITNIFFFSFTTKYLR